MTGFIETSIFTRALPRHLNEQGDLTAEQAHMLARLVREEFK